MRWFTLTNLDNDMLRSINIVEFSDTHVGNARTPMHTTLKILNKMFPDVEKTSEIDLVFIAGDFFDKSLLLHSVAAAQAMTWILYFLELCARRNIKVRVLEGTPLHDRHQPRLFETLTAGLTIKPDVKYFSTLDIEHIDDFGIDVLYIPDEYLPTHEATWLAVNELLAKRQLAKVDFAIMHGMMDHQFPAGIPQPCHDYKSYADIVNHYIFMGHIHQWSKRGKLLVAGSTNRLCHGEEGKKGYWHCIVNPDNVPDKLTFIDNKDAYVFLTIDCTGLDIEVAHKKIASHIGGLIEASIRIKCDREDAMAKGAFFLKEKYPHLTWTPPKITYEEKLVSDELLLDVAYEAMSIDAENIASLVMERLPTDTPNNHVVEIESIMKEKVNATRH